MRETDIDTELLAVLKEVGSLVPGILQKTDTMTLLINTSNIALPTDIIDYVDVLDSSGVPLVKRPLSHVLGRLRASTTAGAAEIYSFFDRKIYVYPIVSVETVLTILYNHDDAGVNSIGMSDEALETLVEGVCHKVELSKGVLGELSQGAITHYTFYQDGIKVLQARYRIYTE